MCLCSGCLCPSPPSEGTPFCGRGSSSFFGMNCVCFQVLSRLWVWQQTWIRPPVHPCDSLSGPSYPFPPVPHWFPACITVVQMSWFALVTQSARGRVGSCACVENFRTRRKNEVVVVLRSGPSRCGGGIAKVERHRETWRVEPGDHHVSPTAQECFSQGFILCQMLVSCVYGWPFLSWFTVRNGSNGCAYMCMFV